MDRHLRKMEVYFNKYWGFFIFSYSSGQHQQQQHYHMAKVVKESVAYYP